jgi:hypothetical protein
MNNIGESSARNQTGHRILLALQQRLAQAGLSRIAIKPVTPTAAASRSRAERKAAEARCYSGVSRELSGQNSSSGYCRSMARPAPRGTPLHRDITQFGEPRLPSWLKKAEYQTY